MIFFDRLGEEVVRPGPDGTHGVVDRAEAGHDHDPRRGRELADALEELEAVHARHLQVGEHEVAAALFKGGDGGAGGREGVDLAVGPLGKDRANGFAHEWVVVHDENLTLGHHAIS